ncbi:response regulator, partial [Enterobacter asburiae]|uniref:response regulator n=1 Tax=Enterobacter asburiae TaxID=61645 RepID=UPI003C7449DA
MKPAILVVDDDTAVCELLQDVLSEHVFSVLACHNGQDALRQVQQDPNIALVLLDMMLPDINGLQVLLQLQKQRPALPVIMLTVLRSESDVVPYTHLSLSTTSNVFILALIHSLPYQQYRPFTSLYLLSFSLHSSSYTPLALPLSLA